MIFDYYCIDCGQKFEGGEICFDLAELLGLRQDGNDTAFQTSATIVNLERLNEIARYSGNSEGLKHGVKSTISVTLKEFLELMAENEKNKELFRSIGQKTYGDLIDILRELYTGNQVGQEADTEVMRFQSSIQARFSYVPEDENESEPEEEDSIDLDLFEAKFNIKPEFFENGSSDQIYTVEYNYDIHAVNLRKLGRNGIVRGYCPKCGKPVVDGAGKYRHTLVGLIGVQKAGKTSTIVAMLEEMRLNYKNLGIKYPGNPLWDSRSADRDINLKLYRNGWAVSKTAVNTRDGSFNATLLIESDNEMREDIQKKQIFTFVDIAGEQCYDVQSGTFSTEATQVYPLINSCQIYLLCTGIAPDEEDRNNGEELPPGAILEVCNGIYGILREPENVPPLCIVATKADLAGGAEAREEEYNPFHEVDSGSEYLYKEELQNFSMLYESAVDENVRTALMLCCSAYEAMKNTTYVSMISCWALGRKGLKVPEDMNLASITPYKDPFDGQPKPFTRKRIDQLCRWIFEAAGIREVEGFSFTHIPSMGEGYQIDDMDTKGTRKLYPVSDAVRRIETVQRVFINCPDEEENIRMELKDFEENPPRLFYEKKRRNLYEELF